MDKQVFFKNKGEIDLRAITTFGVSAKENDNPIGHFGTGLKYAIAILMREGCELTVFTGKQDFQFSTKKIEMRGKEFEVITMNDQELPFTTELGKGWEMWQAFREIYCNCIDEGGKVSDSSEGLHNDETLFVIEGQKFYEQYLNRHEIYLNVDKNLSVLNTDEVEVFNRPSKFLYYRGVRVKQFSRPADLTYNIKKHIELTEDRTLKYSHNSEDRVVEAIGQLKDKNILHDLLVGKKDTYEKNINYSYLSYRSDLDYENFLDFLEAAYAKNDDSVPVSAIKYYTKAKAKDSLKNYEIVSLDDIEHEQLIRAEKICSNLFRDFSDYPIMTVKTLGRSVMALADRKQDKIIVSRDCFDMGTKYLVATLIEEYMHLKTGYNDHTRELQTYLFDTICTLTEKFVIKEPI